MSTLRIGLLGLGTVGLGVADLLATNGVDIASRCGQAITIAKALVRDTERELDHDMRLTTVADEILNDNEIDIIVEVMGGIHPAFSYVSQALQAGKPVVTANKALIAERGNELFALANETKTPLLYEAAVAGAIPIIRALAQGLTANRVQWIAGIINGTSNYILSAMSQEGACFDDVLARAQALGYAEADPSFDIDGIDVAHKLAILAAIAFAQPLAFEQVYCQGISHITPLDIQYAHELGYCIKPLAIAERRAHGLLLRVHPTLIPHDNLLAHVNGVMNAVMIQADQSGPTLYYGAGAGAKPTASSVVADIIALAKNRQPVHHHRVPFDDYAMLSISELSSEYYLRLQAHDEAGVLSNITQCFARENISIEALLQKAPSNEQANVPIVIKTHQVKEENLMRALAEIKQLPHVANDIIALRICHLENHSS